MNKKWISSALKYEVYSFFCNYRIVLSLSLHRNKKQFETHLETSETHAPKGEHENFVTTLIEAVAAELKFHGNQ